MPNTPYKLGYANATKSIRRQPNRKTPWEITETFVEDKSEEWKEEFVRGFWNGIDQTDFARRDKDLSRVE